MSAHVWLREERFDAALPLGSRSLRGLTVSQVHEVVRALRASQPRAASSAVQYATWVTAAWRILQWAEPASKLFWEMLSLQETSFSSSKGADEVAAAASPTVPAQVPLCHLVLFLWLHLPDAFTKVTSHPSSYNIIWPPSDSSSVPPQASSPTFAPCPLGASGGGAIGAMGSRLVPGLKTGLSQLSFVHNSSYGSPHSPHHHHYQSPRSPRSYQLQAWSKVEAHHLTFFKKHMRDILWSLSLSSSDADHKEGEQAITEMRGHSSWSIRREEFDALTYLCGGSEASPGEGSSSSSLGSRWDQEVEQLSNLVPYWRQQATSDPCPLDVLTAWLEEALCVNDKLYPPPPDPFSSSASSQSAPQHVSSNSSANSMDVEHQAQLVHHSIPRPIPVSLLNHATIIKRATEIGNGERRLYINHCHESHIYILGPVAFACLVGCTDCTIIVGATAGLVRVAHCERITLITCCRRLVVSNCLDSIFFIFTAFPPVLVGENRGCRLAPYNTCYPGLKSHLLAAGLPSGSPPAVNCWNSPIDLSSANIAWMVPQTTPREHQSSSPSSSHMGIGETSLASPSSSGSPSASSSGGDWVLPVESFHTLCVPGPAEGDDDIQLENPFALPQEYTAVLRERSAVVESLRARMMEELNDGQRGQVEEYLRAKFLEWLWSSGQMRQVTELIQLTSPGTGNGSMHTQQQPIPPPSSEPPTSSSMDS